MKADLPTKETPYKVTYAVHKLLDFNPSSAEATTQSGEQVEKSTEFIGFLSLKSVSPEGDAQRRLALPEHLTLPARAATTTLTVEVAYAYLPKAWGKGYATESLIGGVNYVFENLKLPRIMAITSTHNTASRKVLLKAGFAEDSMLIEYQADVDLYSLENPKLR